ncbi:MAG: putative metal-binding motif-containing protein [Pseudomonadota bacterium]
MRPLLLLAIGLLTGCPPKPQDTSLEVLDADGDGYTAQEDCDDGDPAVHPGAPEVCDGLDDDCDGFLDEADPDLVGDLTLYVDADGDTWGSADPAAAREACDLPASGWVEQAGDCDDADPGVHPEADERCDGRDEDCDGAIDEDAVDATTWYPDADGDGWGDEAAAVVACSAPSGLGEQGGDCDDADPGVHPGVDEHCDGRDEDCDGDVDEDAVDAGVWYQDADGDGFGDAAGAVLSCSAWSGYVADDTDCDDAAAGTHPGADETCDRVDQDCDGSIDEDPVDPATWYADNDADGYGDPLTTTEACAAPAGYVADATDCDAADGSIHPGASEHCDGVDEDCDGTADEGAADAPTWYADADGDGHGDPLAPLAACTAPGGHLSDAGDCDDADASVHPDAAELCDGVDQDCDGVTDEDAVDAATWYTDGDGDGYGAPLSSVLACTAPRGRRGGRHRLRRRRHRRASGRPGALRWDR